MKNIYAFFENSMVSDIQPILNSLSSIKKLKIEALTFSDKQTSEPNSLYFPSCFLVFFNAYPRSINTACFLVKYCIEKNLKIIPIFHGTQIDSQNAPEILSQVHILSFYDPFIINKLIYLLHVQCEDSKAFFQSVRTIKELWVNEKKDELTPKQLFQYAIALFYGIEIKPDYNTSLILQMELIGNEAFEPQMIKPNTVPLHIADKQIKKAYIESIKQYIRSEIQHMKQTESFDQIEKILEYSYLLNDIFGRFHFGNEKISQELKQIFIMASKSTPSVAVTLWLFEDFWYYSMDAVQDHRHHKMLDYMLEILFYSDKTLEKYDDTVVKLYLFKAASVVGMYNAIKPQVLLSVMHTKRLDTYADIPNTFRQFHETRSRSAEERSIMRNLQINYAWDENVCIDSFFSESELRLKQEQLLQAISDAVELLFFCKCHYASNYFSVWFQRNIQVLIDFIPEHDSIGYLNILRHYVSYIQLIFNPQISSEALLYAATHLEELYNLCKAKGLDLSFDRIEIYTLLIKVYSETKQYEKCDFYQLKLFEITSVQNRDNVEKINNMLIKCYNIASNRLEQSLYEQAKLYIRFGYDFCKTYKNLPDWLQTNFDLFKTMATQLKL